MHARPGQPDLINLYALVTYLPEPLRRFLNNLRMELVSGCHLRAHVTVLPPRLLASEKAAWNQLVAQMRDFDAFELELGEICVFCDTNVIYLSIWSGREKLIELHDRLAQGALAFDEPFPFQPHITLAQGLPVEQVAAAKEYAAQAWAAYSGPRSFTLDLVSFVQSTRDSEWVDLGELALGTVQAAAS
jgi:2'-5' RNA ligase